MGIEIELVEGKKEYKENRGISRILLIGLLVVTLLWIVGFRKGTFENNSIVYTVSYNMN